MRHKFFQPRTLPCLTAPDSLPVKSHRAGMPEEWQQSLETPHWLCGAMTHMHHMLQGVHIMTGWYLQMLLLLLLPQ